jgi:hypothetical protein
MLNGDPNADFFQNGNFVLKANGTLGSGQEPAREFIHTGDKRVMHGIGPEQKPEHYTHP